MADPVLWERLRAKSNDDLISRAEVRIVEEGIYEIDVLNEKHQLDSNRQIILRSGQIISQEMDDHCSTALISYLLECKSIDPAGEWVSPTELASGAQFFRGPHGVPVNKITARFGNDKTRFEEVCKRLGGEPVEYADAAYSFSVFKRIPVAVLLWLEDDEFPARVSILVDRNAHLHFQLDALLGVFMIIEEALLRS